uniref:Uncharacterized protein n=1 Tax=Panagrolaimus superbus TaxID=310955 RepID=A0A914Y795_9BILA
MTIGITENDSSNAYVAVKNVSHVKVVLNPSNTESALANLFYNEHPLAFEIWLNRRNTIGIGYRNGFPNGVPIAVNAISNALFKSVLKLKGMSW